MSGASLPYALRIIDGIARSEEPLGFSELKRMLDISPATMSQVLKTLMAEDILEKRENGKYGLGRRLSFWGLRASNLASSAVRLRQDLEHISKTIGATALCGVRASDVILVVERVLDANSPALGSPGTLYPINLAVAGAVFAAAEHEWTVEKIESDLKAFPGVRCSIKDALRLVARAHKEACMDDEGLFFPGSRRITVPVAGSIPATRFLTVGAASPRFEEDPSLRSRIIDLLREAAQRQIGGMYQPAPDICLSKFM